MSKYVILFYLSLITDNYPGGSSMQIINVSRALCMHTNVIYCAIAYKDNINIHNAKFRNFDESFVVLMSRLFIIYLRNK